MECCLLILWRKTNRRCLVKFGTFFRSNESNSFCTRLVLFFKRSCYLQTTNVMMEMNVLIIFNKCFELILRLTSFPRSTQKQKRLPERYLTSSVRPPARPLARSDPHSFKRCTRSIQMSSIHSFLINGHIRLKIMSEM